MGGVGRAGLERASAGKCVACSAKMQVIELHSFVKRHRVILFVIFGLRYQVGHAYPRAVSCADNQADNDTVCFYHANSFHFRAYYGTAST